jgi:excisionase family DNA binding protein
MEEEFIKQNELLTADELAKMLKVSRRFIEVNTGAGRIPGQIKVGRLWRYRKTVIQRALIGAQFLIKGKK